MEIRKTEWADLPAVMKVYEAARAFMRAHGNPNQWGDSHPAQSLVEGDIARGDGYVVTDGGEIVGAFALLFGEDPTYGYIKDGAWRSSSPYGTIHRLASSGKVRGVSAAIFAFAKGKSAHLRADTHADNLPMQNALAKAGFVRVGTIYLANGAPRLAYDFLPPAPV